MNGNDQTEYCDYFAYEFRSHKLAHDHYFGNSKVSKQLGRGGYGIGKYSRGCNPFGEK